MKRTKLKVCGSKVFRLFTIYCVLFVCLFFFFYVPINTVTVGVFYDNKKYSIEDFSPRQVRIKSVIQKNVHRKGLPHSLRPNRFNFKQVVFRLTSRWMTVTFKVFRQVLPVRCFLLTEKLLAINNHFHPCFPEDDFNYNVELSEEDQIKLLEDYEKEKQSKKLRKSNVIICRESESEFYSTCVEIQKTVFSFVGKRKDF